MMKGQLLIDSIDIHAKYGVFLSDGGYEGLISYPALKKVKSIDWAEDNGIEVDLATPVLDSKSVTLKFAYYAFQSRPEAFVEMLADGAYHTFDFKDLGRIYKLRLNTQSNLSTMRDIGSFSLQFDNDFPLMDYSVNPPLGYTYLEPQSSYNTPQGYYIDGKSLSDYGLFLTGKSMEEIEKTPKVKPNLLRNIDSQGGAIYDGHTVLFQTKDVTLDCFMRADTLVEFWRNYDALLHDLTLAEQRELYIASREQIYPCHYKSSQVSHFMSAGVVWCEFSITLLFTSFRTKGEEYLLTTEDNIVIITEDNKVIDLKI